MRYLIALLAIAGVIVSALALHVHYSSGNEVCSINEHWDCGVVNHSEYAVLHGVPVAIIGIAGYLLLAGLAYARQRGLLFAAAAIGCAFALRLTWIEKHILEVWCLYCVISQCLIALIAGLSLAWWVTSFGRRRRVAA